MKRIKLIKTLTSLGALGILGTGTSMLVTSCNGPKHGDRQLSTDITKDSLSATIDYDLWNPNVSNETKTDYIMNVIKSEFPNVITQDLKINNPEIWSTDESIKNCAVTIVIGVKKDASTTYALNSAIELTFKFKPYLQYALRPDVPLYIPNFDSKSSDADDSWYAAIFHANSKYLSNISVVDDKNILINHAPGEYTFSVSLNLDSLSQENYFSTHSSDAILNVTSFDKNTTTDDKCFTYTYDKDKAIATVTGIDTKHMDFVLHHAVTIEIPSTVNYGGDTYKVTDIATNAFSDDFNTGFLKRTLILPNTLRHIFSGAFWINNDFVGELRIPDTSEPLYIDQSAFGEMHNISSLYIGKHVLFNESKTPAFRLMSFRYIWTSNDADSYYHVKDFRDTGDTVVGRLIGQIVLHYDPNNSYQFTPFNCSSGRAAVDGLAWGKVDMEGLLPQGVTELMANYGLFYQTCLDSLSIPKEISKINSIDRGYFECVSKEAIINYDGGKIEYNTQRPYNCFKGKILRVPANLVEAYKADAMFAEATILPI
ncbi:MAG: hypothetical protein LBF00_03595 [Mycoplasmataceae bacterium]|nr:hypothetical protein [Mycoplasmataceae bacterium]